jgi:hypothetical protein
MFQLKRTISALLLSAILLSAIAAQATTYYVAPNGNDSNAGTQASPFRNIQKAADVVNPGDTVNVLDGSYPDHNGDKIIVLLTRSGAPGAPITFRSVNKWGAVMRGLKQTDEYGWGFSPNVGYITIDGFEIKDMGLPGDAIIMNAAGLTNITIKRNWIHHIGRICSSSGNAGNGVLMSGTNIVVEQNLIHDIGRLSVGEQGCGLNTMPNHDHGLYITDVTNLVIKNNIFYNSFHGWALHFFGGAANGVDVFNNTFAFQNIGRPNHVIISQRVANGRFYNNISYNAGCSFVYFDDRGFTLSVSLQNNLVYGAVLYQNNQTMCTSGTGTVPGVTASGNMGNTDPKFVNVAGNDFHLQASSLAIDAGITISAVTADYDGMARLPGAASDIGAFEFQGNIPLLPPKNLRIQ